MQSRSLVSVFGAFGICLGALSAQESKPALQERLLELKKSLAENQARLKTYQWVETTEVSLKGEVKKREQNQCRYGADGQVVKTPVGTPAPTKEAPRGLKGRIVAKKVEELKDYMDRFGNLVRRYVPPDPQAMQAAFQAGKASLERPGDSTLAALVFLDYAKPGDQVTVSFDPMARKLRTFRVTSYLDGPEDKVRVDVTFDSLADGTNYVEQTLLESKSKQLQIRTTNFGHRKSGR